MLCEVNQNLFSQRKGASLMNSKQRNGCVSTTVNLRSLKKKTDFDFMYCC